MYKYSNNLLPECIALLYLQNDSIHEAQYSRMSSTQSTSLAKSFSNRRARIWNVLLIKLTVMFRCQY